MLLAALSAKAWAADSLTGFAPGAAATERETEKNFDAGIHSEDIRGWIERMASEPNQVGSPHDKANAEFVLSLFRDWGWDAHIETFQVLYPTPKKVALEMVAPTRFHALLHEPAIEGDKTSERTKGALPPYNVFGADGDVTGELVYVNFGMPDDYVDLERRGVSVKGRVAIARYGGGWRGLKPKLAQEHGAIACLIYSDPHEDGYAVGDVYPKGGTRPENGVQRGSVADMTLFPGDPLTPGVGATADARRLKISEAPTIMKIPVIPISYGDARPLLAALDGPVAPAGWRGALPITYHLGPGAAKVHVTVLSDWSLRPIYDVIAVMKGSVYPDQWIIRGNHHDGWVFGAWDPLSGHAALLAEAKAIGTLIRGGWRPRRTLVYASWDGEEPGLMGSTEWAETHAEELRKKAVLYVNSDENGRGFLNMGGSHSLQGMVNEIADEVIDPETGVSVLARRRARDSVEASGKDAGEPQRAMAADAMAGRNRRLEALGSGSDYTPFLQHLGIATLDFGYSGEGISAGIYHSAYDSYEHFARFGDVGMAYGPVLARTVGRVILRAADADVIPMKFTDLADTVGRYLEEVRRLNASERTAADATNRLLESRAFQLAADPHETYLPPKRAGAVPQLDFAPLDRAFELLQSAAHGYDEALSKAAGAGFALDPQVLARVNEALQGIEPSLMDLHGLPGRGWFKHTLYAPGLYTGYGSKTLPAVRESIEQHQWELAQRSINSVADVLDGTAAHLAAAAALVGGSTAP